MKQGWEIKTLGEVCTIKGGYTPQPCELFREGIIPYFKVSDMNAEGNEILMHQTLLYLASAKRTFPKGSIVFPKNGGAVATNKKRILKDDSVVDLNTGVATPSSKIGTKYLYYFFVSIDFNKFIKDGTLPVLRIKDIADLSLLTPPIDEQERIVGILDSAFAKIEALRANAQQNLQNTKDLFQASLKQELTPKQKGKYKLVKDLFDIKTGKLNANAAEENGAYPFFTYSREVYAINQFAFDCEAVLLAGNNASGDFNVKHYKGKFNAYQRTYVITTKNNQTHCQILYYVLENYLSELKSMSVGANTKFLKLGMIENVQMPDFTLIEQQQVVEKLDALSERCRAIEENYRQTIAHCNALKQALLTKAFNGEL